MESASWILEVILGTVLVAGLHAAPASDLFDVDVRQLADAWEKEHISPSNPYSLRHSGLKRRLQQLSSSFPDLSRVEPAGNSVEGRGIFLVTLGQGPERILLWSQMHGDEPTATCAILGLLQFLSGNRRQSGVTEILQKYTLFITGQELTDDPTLAPEESGGLVACADRFQASAPRRQRTVSLC
jgi:hypothetical protein